jgi:hypothetical protein
VPLILGRVKLADGGAQFVLQKKKLIGMKPIKLID